MDDEFKYKEISTGLAPETVLDLASLIASAVPSWLAGPVSSVLNGISVTRRLDRVNELLAGLGEKVRDLESDVSREYVKTEDFEELLEQTIKQVATERNEEKRRIYRDFLIGAIARPGEPYDEQYRFLRTMGELQSDHLQVLKALSQAPRHIDFGLVGSPIATLQSRLHDFTREQIEEQIQQLNDLRLTDLTSLHTMMTPQGAEDLRGAITVYGRRFIEFMVR